MSLEKKREKAIYLWVGGSNHNGIGEKLMRNTLKTSKIGVGISLAAMLLALITMLISGFGWAQITMLCCLICIFCANLTTYLSAKKKGDGDN